MILCSQLVNFVFATPKINRHRALFANNLSPMTTNTNTSASAGAIETNDVAPIPAGERHGKPWHLFTVWSSPNLEFATVFVGALGIGFGLNVLQAILAVLVGNALAGITHGIFSTWGPSAGLPQMVLGRNAFGKIGNLLPSGLSTLVAGIGWFAVNTVSGTLALSALLGCDAVLALLIVIVAQVGIAFVGHNLIQVWERYTSYFLALVWLFVAYVVFTHDGAFTPSPAISGFSLAAFTLTAGAAYGYTAGWTPFASDYTRYLPADSNKVRLGLAAGLGNFLSTTILMSLGAVAFNLIETAVGPDNGGQFVVFGDNPTKVFTDALANDTLAKVTLLAIAIGSISANVLNVYSGAMSFLAMGVKLGFKTRRAIMVTIAGVLGGITAYFGVANHDVGHQLENFLLVVSYWVAPWIAIVLLERLLSDGKDAGTRALAPKNTYAGVISFVVAAGVAIYFFSNQVWYKGPLAADYGDIAAVVGFVLAGALYTILRSVLGEAKK
jgi:NCS1 family nucleobase:cation symporter-1